MNKLEITYQQRPGRENETTLLVKDNPFRIILSSKNKDINFKKIILKAKLVYSYDIEKIIPRVKSEPLTYELVPQDDSSIIVDMRVKVLSSQMENNSFKIKFTALNNENQEIDSICSDPIRVVSKRSQLVNEVEQKNSKIYSNTTTIDIFNNYMEKMERQQTQQNMILENIILQNNYRMNLIQQYLKKKKEKPRVKVGTTKKEGNKRKRVDSFNNTLENFVSIYQSLPNQIRIPKLKKLMSEIPKEKAIQLKKIMDEKLGVSIDQVKEDVYF